MASRPALGACALMLFTLFTAACSTIRTESRPGFDPLSVRNYAWGAIEGPDAREMAPDDATLLDRVRGAVDAAFAQIGVALVPPEEAMFLLTAHVDVELKTLSNDPNCSLFFAERYEEGSLRLELEDRSGAEVWLGECCHRLRHVSRAMGGSAGRIYPTDEARDWGVEQMAARIVEELRPAGAADKAAAHRLFRSRAGP